MSICSDSLLTDVVGVFIALIAVVYAYFKWSYQYWKRKNVPYLEPSIPFGNFENSARRTQSFGNQMAQLYRKAKARGLKYCGIYNFSSPWLMVLDLDLLKLVFTKDFPHFVDRGSYTNEKDDPLSAHLFAIGGAKWKRLRTKLTPTFTSGKMKAMFQTLADTGLILENYLRENVSSEDPVDIKDVLGRYSTDIIGSCAFGIDCNSFKEPNSPFRVYGKKVFVEEKIESMKIAFCTSFPEVGRKLGIKVNKPDVSQFFYKMTTDVVEHREKNNETRKDFLQLLIELKNKQDPTGDPITMDELAAQSFVFFLAGFETSSTTMTFALFELAQNQELQEKVRDEINTVMAKYGAITYDSMNELKYMQQAIDEALRMYSPVPLLTRQCVKDYKVPDSNLVIEKGTLVIIPVEGIHYDEEYYPNPDKFNPDRFSEENKSSRHHYAHLPFGQGPRVCIGERFGVLQSKVGLTAILKNFKITVNKKTKVPLKMSTASFITTAHGEIWLNFEKLRTQI